MYESSNKDEQDPLFEETTTNEVQTWFQENLRVIISIFIVGAIALGIYSYSQRTETLSTSDTESSDTTTSETDADASIEDTVTASQTTQEVPSKTPTEISRETEDAFVETAVAGEGTTHLARHALMNFLEKNPDSSLSAEHKVYIEDYLRKQVKQQPVHIGTSAEFSKSLISQAIMKSKTLNAHQLNNLKKYSAHVAAYR